MAADGKLFAAQKSQAYYSAVDAVLFDADAVAGRVVGAAQMSQAQLGLWFYEPACVQVLSVAVFGADAVSPGIVIGFSSDVVWIYQFKVIGQLAAAGDNVDVMPLAAQPAARQRPSSLFRKRLLPQNLFA